MRVDADLALAHSGSDSSFKANSYASDLKVWDTEYCPPSKVFSAFREGLCQAFMPWTPELRSERDFNARIESISLEKGIVSRIRTTPHTTVRTPKDVLNSEMPCIYAAFLLSGSISLEQGGTQVIAQQGDLALFTSEKPVLVKEDPNHNHQALVLLIPTESVHQTENVVDSFTNVVLPKEKIISPLATCASFISEHLLSTSIEELQALFDACASLLPVAMEFREDGANGKFAHQPKNYLQAELIAFVNRNISNPGLTPQQAAAHLGISPRYVHKLLAGSAVTFSSYVMARRLDNIRRELASPTCRPQPISTLAYRWGFEDLSTFNRAFKSKFGCTPSQYRHRSGF